MACAQAQNGAPDLSFANDQELFDGSAPGKAAAEASGAADSLKSKVCMPAGCWHGVSAQATDLCLFLDASDA